MKVGYKGAGIENVSLWTYMSELFGARPGILAADVKGKDEVGTEWRISSMKIYKSCFDYWNAAVYNRSMLTVYGCTFYNGCFIMITFYKFLMISSSNNVVPFNGSPITTLALSWKPKNSEN